MEYYTVKDIMKILHIGHSSAYKLFYKIDFPGILVGNKWMVEKEDFKRFIDMHKGSRIEL